MQTEFLDFSFRHQIKSQNVLKTKFLYKIYPRTNELRDKLLFLHVNKIIMNTKLTLNLDKEIIDEAKSYAKNHQVSLSKLIENYLNSLTRETKKQPSVSSLVDSLTGIIPNDYDEKKEYRNYIDKKYQ